jgi:hypothetical protein
MIQINRTSQINSSVLGSALAGLSKKIAPLVQAELVGVLIAELERHFNEKLLTDLRQRVEDIVTRELDRKVEEIVLQELGRREAVGFRPNFLEQRFTEVYGKALWGDDETRSGWGSKRNSGHVQTALEILRMVIPKYNILSIADIPCGDFNWQPLFLSDHAQVAYIGYDIVGSMIVDNKRKNPNREFRQLDITKQVPAKADLILCKDMFNHLTYADIRRAIGNMKRSGSTYLLASNDFTFPQNVDVVNEGSNDRPVDVVKAPLSYPAPLWNNHYMGLWLLALM